MRYFIILLLVTAFSVDAGTVVRQNDFEAATSVISARNYHGGSGAPEVKRWSYFLLNNWDKSYNRKNNDYDWGKALNSKRMKPFLQSAPFKFEKELVGPIKKGGRNYFERYRYTLTADRLYLCWNQNAVNPMPDLTSTAIVMEYNPAAPGSYSLSGKLRWTSIRGPNLEQAWYVIGKMNQARKFTKLYSHEFEAKQRFITPQVFVDLAAVKPLQNIELTPTDKLVFIIAGSRMNYRGIEVFDGALKISSDAIKTVSAKDLHLQKALALLDFRKKELCKVKQLHDKGDMAGAFDAYKKILVKRVAFAKPIENYSYWLYYCADADELLKGILTTQQYGKKKKTTTMIGLPGKVQWYKVPDDGYTTLLRDITTMHWVTKLAEKYRMTGEVKYLNAWQGYWSDLADNWPAEYLKARRNPKVMALVAKNSIAWSDIALYIGWRVENFNQGFNAVAHEAEKNNQVDKIKNIDLAKLLVHLVTFEVTKGLRWIERNVGAPNQRVHCATALFELGIYLADFKQSAKWRKMAIEEVLRCGYLADGTDMEQSLNYNKGLGKTIEKFLEKAQNLPASERGSWLDRLKHMYKYRYYFMHAIAKPNGAQPIVGNNNTWRNYGKAVQVMPGLAEPGNFYDKKSKNNKGFITDFSSLPLSKTIKEYVYAKQRIKAPAFNSVFFPYGGYVIQRDGWDPESLYCFMKTSRPGKGHMKEQGNGIQLSAYGQDLIVSSGGAFYTPGQMLKNFWASSAAWNTIIVDGYNQYLQYNANIPVAYKKPIETRYLNGKFFDFAEGRFRGGYGGLNIFKHGSKGPEYDFVKKDKVITDVTHDRQLIFMRKQKMWIVTDIINSGKEHEFTQSWLLAPEYKPEMVKAGNHIITTTRDNAVNLAIYQFGIDKLKYSKHCGVYTPESIIGWIAMEDKSNPRGYTPAVDVLVQWKSKGKSILISAIVPYKTSNPVKSVSRHENGFELTFKNGEKVVYNYIGKNSEAKLQTSDAELVLTAQGGYEQGKNGKRTDVIRPETFKWKQTPNGEVPQYK